MQNDEIIEKGGKPYDGEIFIDYAITIDPVGVYKEISWNVPGFNVFTTHGEDISSRNIHGKYIKGNYMENRNYSNVIHTCSVCKNHSYTHTNIDDCEAIQDSIKVRVQKQIQEWPFE